MARPDKRPSAGSTGSSSRVTPKGGSPTAPPQRSTPRRRTNRVAVVLIVLILVGLVAGTVGVALTGGSTTVEPIPTPAGP